MKSATSSISRCFACLAAHRASITSGVTRNLSWNICLPQSGHFLPPEMNFYCILHEKVLIGMWKQGRLRSAWTADIVYSAQSLLLWINNPLILGSLVSENVLRIP